MTTLQAYGFDSYPYLHVARRLGLPYGMVLLAVDMIDRGIFPSMLPPFEAAVIQTTYDEEQRRRANAGGR